MRRMSILLLILFTFLSTSAWSQGQPQWWKNKIIKFDAPSAGTAAGQGTMPVGVVQGDWIMGSYIDANNVAHGFLRAPEGTITKFDVPGGAIVSVWGMTPALEIAGTYLDANNVLHGFLRKPSGRIITIDAPGAAGTESESLNPAGVLQGDYADANFVYHGFLRARDGTFTTFDPPGAGTGAYQARTPRSSQALLLKGRR